MNDVMWLFLAFIAVWVALGGYLLSISRRQKRLEERLERDPAKGRGAAAP